MRERVLMWKGKTIRTDTNIPEDLTVLMKVTECILELHQSIISDDVLLDNIAKLKKSTKCAYDIVRNMALESWKVDLNELRW